MKALVVFDSKAGTTKKFANQIVEKIKKSQHEVIIKDIDATNASDVANCDLIYMGSWTRGHFIFGQKPSENWVNFVSRMPEMIDKKTVLFTTYTLATGSVFRNMKKHVLPKGFKVIGSMKSRSGKIDYYSNAVLKYSLN